MVIKAWLDGDPADLDALARLLPDGDTRVVHDAERDGYYLTAPEIDNPPTGQAYYEVAKALVVTVNGFARATNTTLRPVKLKGSFSEGASEHQVIFLESVAELRIQVGRPTITVTKPDGTVVPSPPPRGPGRFAAASKHPDTVEALEIMGQSQQLGWVELYKIHEIIRDAIMPDKIHELGWADKVTDSAFTGSANLPGVSGSSARHARMPGVPKNTMTIAEGRDYIRGLVIRWLDSLAGT
ncbi:hypothetical protein [Mycobacterium sp. SMC-15]|uniref:hypothetical protein n=1 Tax=Mycobacterium sp. SMC-15 TaxID=3381627 RepID=UPI0038771886